MEIFLQWLDDLDDLVMTVPLIAAHVLRHALSIGLLALVVLGGAAMVAPAIWAVLGASAVAAASSFLRTISRIAATQRRPLVRDA